MMGSTKKIYDKILNSHTALGIKYKGTPTCKQKIRENGIKSELRERKETPEAVKVTTSTSIKQNAMNHSIDAIMSLNQKIKMMK